MTDLHAGFRQQAHQCRLHGSPLTAALLEGAAEDLAAGGATAELVAPLAGLASGAIPSLRFAGAVHRMVLERRAPEVALHYPSVGGTAPVEQVWPAAHRLVQGAARELRPLLDRPVQTNEVGRSAVLFGGLLHVVAATGLPVRLLEIGASAGLNLHVDRYAYDVADGRVLGDPASPVRLHRPWSGPLPPYEVGVQVVERAGCDPAPLDPRAAADRTTLTSYVWGDQVERLDRLRGGLEVAARRPVPVERLAASPFLARELAVPRPGVATVVWQSVVWQYLDPAERTRITDVLAQAGERARAGAPLAHLTLEPVRVQGDEFTFLVRLTSWPDGATRTLAGAQGHGPPVVWR